MPDHVERRLWFSPSQMAEGTWIEVRCDRCQATRWIGRIEAQAKFGDIPLRDIERRLKCTDRGRGQRGRVCGGRGVIEIARAREDIVTDLWGSPPTLDAKSPAPVKGPG